MRGINERESGIYAGGFTGGYPSEIEFDWEHMAKKGMVVCRGFESAGLQIIHILGHRYRTD